MPAVDFAAAVFLAAGFFAAGFFAVDFFGGAAARRSASSSAARCSVMDSTSSLLRRLALVSPSVAYGPQRPSFSTTGFPEFGSSPSSRSGGLAAPRPRPRAFGWASSAFASSSVIVKICSSPSSERESVPRLMYGP